MKKYLCILLGLIMMCCVSLNGAAQLAVTQQQLPNVKQNVPGIGVQPLSPDVQNVYFVTTTGVASCYTAAGAINCAEKDMPPKPKCVTGDVELKVDLVDEGCWVNGQHAFTYTDFVRTPGDNDTIEALSVKRIAVCARISKFFLQ